jgi:hypothetical protein
VRDKKIVDSTIFHFGTGGHHHLGHSFHKARDNNAVIGITASPSEYEAYIKLSIEKPEIVRLYKVFFGDIYQLEQRLLPTFDIVTLFHLCEFRNEKNDTYGALTDLGVVELFMKILKSTGSLALYTGSYAWPQAKVIIDDLCAQQRLVKSHVYKTLIFYTLP